MLIELHFQSVNWRMIMAVQPDSQIDQAATPDSYDLHIIPAETAARKDREGNDFKHIPKNEEHSQSLDTTGGYTVDQEGLANNYAVEPEMYVETPGDMSKQSEMAVASNDYTIVDVFASTTAAESVVAKMIEAGLAAHKISILGHDYQDTEHVQGGLNWKDIARSHGLAAVLIDLGIASDEASRYETEIKAGKFVVLVVGCEADIVQVNQILHTIGHKTLVEASD
jgi:hypothetical protein